MQASRGRATGGVAGRRQRQLRFPSRRVTRSGYSSRRRLGHATDDPELRVFLAKADAAKTEMVALRTMSSPDCGPPTRPPRSSSSSAPAPASSQHRLHSFASSVQRAASAPASRPWTAGRQPQRRHRWPHVAARLCDCMMNLSADLQVLRRQVSAERRDDAVGLRRAPGRRGPSVPRRCQGRAHRGPAGPAAHRRRRPRRDDVGSAAVGGGSARLGGARPARATTVVDKDFGVELQSKAA
jgi:hypothetical protein